MGQLKTAIGVGLEKAGMAQQQAGMATLVDAPQILKTDRDAYKLDGYDLFREQGGWQWATNLSALFKGYAPPQMFVFPTTLGPTVGVGLRAHHRDNPGDCRIAWYDNNDVIPATYATATIEGKT